MFQMLQIREILILGLIITCIAANPPEFYMRPPRPSQNFNYNRYNPHALSQPPQIQPEPSFMQRLVGWFNPFGGNYNEVEDSVPAGTYNDNVYTQTAQIRDTEPTTRTTPRPSNSGKIPVSKCSPCNQVPWIPMIPTYQLPVLNPTGQVGPYPPSVYFKHQFGDQPYTQIPTQAPVSSTTPLKLVNYPYPGQVVDESLQAPPASGNSLQAQSYYRQPWTTQSPPVSVTPLKLQSFNQQPWAVQPWTSPPPTPQKVQSYYKAPEWSTQSTPVSPIKQQQYPYQNSKYQQHVPHLTLQQQVHQQYQGNLHGNLQNQNTPFTSIPPQFVDPATISFTTNRPLNRNRQVAASSLTNQEYLPPPNVLPLESEGSQYQPIPIPNLSATPIPPLYDSKPFLSDPYFNEDTGFIKLVPLEPESQLSNKVNVQALPNAIPSSYEPYLENDSFSVYKSLQVEHFTTAPEVFNTERTFITSQPVFRVTDFNLVEESQTMTPIFVDGNELVTDTVASESEADEMEHRQKNFIDDERNDNFDTIAEESSRVIPIKPQRTHQRAELESEFVVKFEPSIQTSSDLSSAETQRKNKYADIKRNRERETPKEMLDVPIFHITQPTRQTTQAPPAFKPLADFTKALSTLWTVKPRISSSTEATVTPTYYSVERTTTEQPIRRPQIEETAHAVETQKQDQFKFATKKPKQIQIIIPYTSYHKPSPFKAKEEQGEPITYKPIRGHYVTLAQKHDHKNEIQDEQVFNKKPSISSNVDNFNGHGYHNDQEYSENGQESKIVESKVTQEPFTKSTKYLTKILATNIKELLKKEKTPKPQKHYSRVDIIRLQKNIDGWTEQSFLNKASTISLRHHTKMIPKEYLTTAFYRKPSPFSTSTMPTTYDPELMEDTKIQYSNILYKNDDEIIMTNPHTIKRNDVSRFLSHENEIHEINNNLTYTSDSGVKIFVPKSIKSTPGPKELWNQTHLTVSPLTKEKIYVVTPQPFAHHDSRINSFKSPRFAVRPSPGAQQKSMSQNSSVKKETKRFI